MWSKASSVEALKQASDRPVSTQSLAQSDGEPCGNPRAVVVERLPIRHRRPCDERLGHPAGHRGRPAVGRLLGHAEADRPLRDARRRTCDNSAASRPDGRGGRRTGPALAVVRPRLARSRSDPRLQAGGPGVAARDTGSTSDYSFIRCSGDAMQSSYSLYEFDQNSSTWTGTVRVATESDLDEKEAQFWVWEDDSGRCDGVYDLVPKADTTDWSLSSSDIVLGYLTASAVTACHAGLGPNSREACLAYLYLGIDLYSWASGSINDDLIGIAKGKECFANLTGNERYCQIDEDGNSTSAYIELTDNYATRELCPPDVTMLGDSYACAGGYLPDGSLYASTSPTTGTLSYKWYEDGILRGTSSTYNMSVGTRLVKVEVTRAYDGLTDSHTKNIPVYDGDDPPQGVSCIE